MHRQQIVRWKERIKDWEEAGCKDTDTPFVSRTRIRKHEGTLSR